MKKSESGLAAGGFAGRLRRARTDAGMSQRDLEKTSGIPKSRISRYENGHLLPSLGGLQKLSKSLGVSDSALLGGADDVYTIFAHALRRHGVSFSSAHEAEAAAQQIAGALLTDRSAGFRAARDPLG